MKTSRPKMYYVWAGMKNRCLNKNYKQYKDYGGRGISVQNEWNLFKNFQADMFSTYKKGLTLDRIDNSKGYSKENCRWVSATHQNRNTRKNIIYKGEYATDACKRLGGASGLIRMRLNYGWSLEKAFSKKVNKSKKYD